MKKKHLDRSVPIRNEKKNDVYSDQMNHAHFKEQYDLGDFFVRKSFYNILTKGGAFNCGFTK